MALKPLHPSARTTWALRKRIQHSEDSDRALAAKLGLNVKTVAKWRKRSSADDAPMGPRRVAPTSLNALEEAFVVVARKMTRASLDQLLSALRRQLPSLSRSALYRCQRKWGVNRIPRRLRAAPSVVQSAALLRIFLHTCLNEDGEPAHLLTAVNGTQDWLHACAFDEFGAPEAKRFLDEILEQADFHVGSIVTGPHVAFCDPAAPEKAWHLFPTVCRKRGVAPIVDMSLPGEPAPVAPGWKDVD